MGSVLTPVQKVLKLAGLASIASDSTYMFYPNDPSRAADNRHYLYKSGAWSDACPLTAGSMAATGEITGGSQSISVTGTVESFSVIWNNSGLPVVAFSAGFNRALTAAERTALSSTTFWAAILPAAINTANCTALYPFLLPRYQDVTGFWDANAITGLANNDPVTTWNDKSGLGINASQAGAASLKPTYLTNQQNGLPVLGFDGGDFLTASNSNFSGSDKPLSVFKVIKRTSTVGAHYSVTVHNAADSSAKRIYVAGFTDAAHTLRAGKISEGGTFKLVNSSSCGNTTVHGICSYIFSPTLLNAWYNGSKVINAQDIDVDAMALDTIRIGGASYSGYAFNGQIAEILIYKSALSDADRQIIQSYLSTKWGIALS